MNTFTLEEKRAILRLLEEVAESDQNLDSVELKYLIEVTKRLDYDPSSTTSFMELSHLEAISILNRMDAQKKNEFRDLMLEMARADNSLPYDETAKLIDIIKEGGMDND